MIRVRCGWSAACACVFLVFMLSARLEGTAQNTAPGAPVPAAILHAKTVFVANGGSETGSFPSPYSGGTERGYTQFYKALSAAKGLELVDDPAKADLVAEIELIAPQGIEWMTPKLRVEGQPVNLAYLRLRVYDRPTHYVLWTFTEPVQTALLQRNSDKNFDQAVVRLATDLVALTGRPATPSR